MPMATETKQWTLQELHSLPEDGNTYELIHGELFVSPAPGNRHETILARLTRILDPYAAANDLGYVFHPRAVVQTPDSQVEPDLMVRQPSPELGDRWQEAPLPSLVVECLSPYSRRRDREHKREFYLEVGIQEYWIIDPDRQNITVVRPDARDLVVNDLITWAPDGPKIPLRFEVHQLFV